MNYLVSPPLYNGSGFNDVLESLLMAFKTNEKEVCVLPLKYEKLNAFGLDNPREYARHCCVNISYLIDKVETGDKVLFLDFFSPGIDILEYYLQRENKKIFKIGLLHGSPSIENDLYENEEWLKYFELGWFKIFDVVVSPSNYFLRYFKKECFEKIIVNNWGLSQNIKPEFTAKTIDVVFPHRFSPDKGVDDFYKIACLMKDINFTVTGFDINLLKGMPNNISALYKQLLSMPNISFTDMQSVPDHISTLKSSKIVLSTALQEGFGYSVFKAVQCGNIPVLPDRCCYPEFFPKEYLYQSLDNAVEMIYKHLKGYPLNYPSIDSCLFNFNPIMKYF